MKKFHTKLVLASAALLAGAAILFGCASAQSLIDKGDPVGAIEKLAKNLSNPKKAKQEEADLFVSLYPAEVENRMEYTTKTVKGLVDDFSRAQGKRDIESALNAKYKSLSANTLITEDYDVRSLLRQAEDIEKNLTDLRRIQKAVASMPSEIGDDKSGEVYTVEKYTENFTSMALNASKELGALYVQLAEVQNPGKTRSEKESIYKLFDKAKEKDSTISKIDARRAQAAYMLAEDYLTLGTTVEEKKSALDWYRKADYAVSGYSDTAEKKKRANYEIGILTMAGIDLEGTVSAAKSALSSAKLNFKEAGDYKDAAEWVAKIEDIQYKLDHPEKEETASSSKEPAPAPEGFVLIKAPTFVRNQWEAVHYNDDRGGSEELVQTKVKLTRSYYICDHEVTLAEAKEISEKYSYNFARSTYSTWEYVKNQLTDDCAFTGLTWVDCLVYCNFRSMSENLTPVYTLNGESDPRKWSFISKRGKVYEYSKSAWESWEVLNISMNLDANGYRMPIEAEWDYAALGDYAKHKEWTSGNERKLADFFYSNGLEIVRFSGYDGSGKQNRDDYVSSWYGYTYNKETDSHALPKIKQKKPNSFGLYDMTGNATEWVWDANYYMNEITDWEDFMYFSKLPETDPINSYKSSYRRFKWIYLNDHMINIGQSYSDFDSAGNLDGLRVVRTAK